MNEDAFSSLYARWPKILAPEDQKVPLYIESGWITLIDELCHQLQPYTDHESAPQVEARQIKEEFGGLSFHVGPAYAAQHALIRFSEELSYSSCETCDAIGQLYKRGYWFTTRCPTHAPEGGHPVEPGDGPHRFTLWLPPTDESKDSGKWNRTAATPRTR